jgi:glycosidase
LEPRNQISKSTIEGGKGVTYVGHWKVTNVNSERNRAYDSRAILATVNFSFDRFDDDTSNIIHRAYNKTCHEIKAMNFDDPENRHIEIEHVSSSGDDANFISNNQSISQDQVRNSSRPTLSDEENHVEVESMSSAVELSSDSDAIRKEYAEQASIIDSSPDWVRQLAETTEPVRVKSEDIFEEQEDYIRAESSDEDAISMLKRENKELKGKVRELTIEHSRTKLQIQRLEKLMYHS